MHENKSVSILMCNILLRFIMCLLLVIVLTGCKGTKSAYNLGVEEEQLKAEHADLREVDTLEFETEKETKNESADYKILTGVSTDKDIDAEYYFIINSRLRGIMALYSSSADWGMITKKITAANGTASFQTDLGFNGAAMVWNGKDSTMKLLRSGPVQAKFKLPSGHLKLIPANRIILLFWLTDADNHNKFGLLSLFLIFGLMGLGIGLFNLTIKKTKEFLAQFPRLENEAALGEFKQIIARQMYVFFPNLICLVVPLILVIYVFVQGILNFADGFICLVIFLCGNIYIFKRGKVYKQLENQLKNIPAQPELVKKRDHVINTWQHKAFPDWKVD